MILWTHVSNHEFGILVICFCLDSITIQGRGWWPRLLDDPLDNGILSSSTGVFGFLSTLEPEECRESLNAESLSKGLLFSRINLGEGDWWIILGQNCGGLFVLWGKLLAVT